MTFSREPAVAGIFYKGEKKGLYNQIKDCLPGATIPKRDSIAVVSPHAGYVYSGKVAASVFSSINIPELCIVIGPNHNGIGYPVSTYKNGEWITPLGSVAIDEVFSLWMQKNAPFIKDDKIAHKKEHSIEVQLPFLQFFSKNFRFFPLCISLVESRELRIIAEKIADGILALERKALIVASSDMNHYESHNITLEKDNMAIGSIIKLDEDELLRNVEQHNISMCGYLCVYLTLIIAKKLGAKRANLVSHITSGEINNDYNAVVGYAGIIIE